MMFVFVEGVGI